MFTKSTFNEITLTMFLESESYFNKFNFPIDFNHFMPTAGLTLQSIGGFGLTLWNLTLLIQHPGSATVSQFTFICFLDYLSVFQFVALESLWVCVVCESLWWRATDVTTLTRSLQRDCHRYVSVSHLQPCRRLLSSLLCKHHNPRWLNRTMCIDRSTCQPPANTIQYFNQLNAIHSFIPELFL